jgi:hypothetical protein
MLGFPQILGPFSLRKTGSFKNHPQVARATTAPLGWVSIKRVVLALSYQRSRLLAIILVSGMARVSDSNVPSVPLRWSVARAGAEFDIAQQTLERKLRDAQLFPDSGGCYSTKQLTQGIFGSLFRERLRRITEEADKVAIANQVARGELLNRHELEQAMAQVADAMVSVIRNSGLSRFDQEQIQKNLSSIPLIIRDQARRQDKRREPGSNRARAQAGASAEAKKRGRPKKRVKLKAQLS